MPVLYLLIVIGLIFLWFFLSGVYKHLGNYINRIIEDALRNLKED